MNHLASLAEMLRLWYVARAGTDPGAGRVRFESRVYAFPRPLADAIRVSLAAKLADATFDGSDPDEFRVIGPETQADRETDLSVWREALQEPMVQKACVILRMTIEGPVFEMGVGGITTATFVVCGAPANGGILVKAIWQLGHDESSQLVYRVVPWEYEGAFLEAFDVYLQESARATAERGAGIAFELFTKRCRFLFTWRGDERKAMWLTRIWAEMPDDRGPAAFIRRVTLPLVAGVGCVALAAVFWRSALPASLSLGGAVCMLATAGRIAWNKLRVVQRYYSAMRLGLGRLYSGPAEYRQIDLSGDQTPTLLKGSAELDVLEAHHVCDLMISTAKSILDGNRIYAIGNATAALGLLRKTENLVYFPASPIILVSTRFSDGRRHYTVNRPNYRKPSRPGITGRCVLRNEGIGELLALHRRQVDKLIASGAVPVPAAQTSAGVMERMRAEHEEGREAWKKSPYSWGDALHDAFKVCRKEYLVD